MLKKCKSLYFTKGLFSFIHEKKKLEIIKYNKNIQKLMDINLINYKFYSQKYVIYEKNGKMKEYYKYNDTLLFEGECLNKKRNGKGKEYNYTGKTLFEGEYLNGKRNGKGKEYYNDGKVKFVGEYLNGFEWNGNGYDNENNIVYSIKNGKGLLKKYDFLRKRI